MQVTSDVENISAESKLKVIKDYSTEARSSTLCIDYVWSGSTEKQSFFNFLFEEALLRSMNIVGKPVEEHRSELKEELLHEIKIKEL